MAGVLLLLALSDDAYATLISMATVGFYIAFAFPVFTALRARLTGNWTTGVWNIGRFGLAVNVVAAAWLAFEIVNIAWPRLPDAPWYVNWGAVLMVVIVAILGVAVRGWTPVQEMPEPEPRAPRRRYWERIAAELVAHGLRAAPHLASTSTRPDARLAQGELALDARLVEQRAARRGRGGAAAAWPKRCATRIRQCQSWCEYGWALVCTRYVAASM